MLYWYVQVTLGILTRIFLRIQVYGSENIPVKRSFLLASNHCSNLDPIIIGVMIRRRLYYLAKAELFVNRYCKVFFKKINMIPLDRQGIGKAALKESLKVLHRGKGLLVFPEGTRSRDGKLGEAKPGVALFAFGAGAPVIPVFIKGTERAMPPRSHFIRFAKIKVYFGKEVIPPKVIDRKDRGIVYQEFTDKVMQEIAALEKKTA